MLWHILMSWGLMNCLIYAAMLRLDNMHSRFKEHPVLEQQPPPASCLPQRWVRRYFWLLPAFSFVPRDTATV